MNYVGSNNNCKVASKHGITLKKLYPCLSRGLLIKSLDQISLIMSRKYQEILVELVNRASKKSRLSGKQLLTLIRELCFRISAAPDRQWVSPLLQIIQNITDSDLDLKIFRICLYLVTSSLLSDSWESLEKDRATLFKEVLAITRHEISSSTGSKAHFLWRTFGSLVAATEDGAYMTYISDSVAQLQNNPSGQKQKIVDADISNWSARLSALRRAVSANGSKGIFPIPMGCIDTICTASGSKNALLAQHGSALLFIAASYPSTSKNNSAAVEGGVICEKTLLAKNLLAAFQATQRDSDNPNVGLESSRNSATFSSLSLNLIDPLSCCHILKTVKVLTQSSYSEEISEKMIFQLHLCCVKLLSHPRYPICFDSIHALLYGQRIFTNIFLIAFLYFLPLPFSSVSL